jgi:hypothetical protein
MPSWRYALLPSSQSNSLLQVLGTQHPKRSVPVSSAGPTFAHPTFLRGQRKPRCAWITLFLLYEIFSGPTFARSFCRAISRDSRGCTISACGPSFPHPFSRRDTDWGHFFSMGAPPSGPHSFLRWAHLYSFRLMKRRLATISFRARSPGYEILEFRKHCKGADSCSDRFRQHRDPVGAHVAEESGPI